MREERFEGGIASLVHRPKGRQGIWPFIGCSHLARICRAVRNVSRQDSKRRLFLPFLCAPAPALIMAVEALIKRRHYNVGSLFEHAPHTTFFCYLTVGFLLHAVCLLVLLEGIVRAGTAAQRTTSRSDPAIQRQGVKRPASST